MSNLKNSLRSFIMLVAPRVGTAGAAWLVSNGIDADLAQQMITGALAALLVGADWATDKAIRRFR